MYFSSIDRSLECFLFSKHMLFLSYFFFYITQFLFYKPWLVVHRRCLKTLNWCVLDFALYATNWFTVWTHLLYDTVLRDQCLLTCHRCGTIHSFACKFQRNKLEWTRKLDQSYNMLVCVVHILFLCNFLQLEWKWRWNSISMRA